VSAPLFSDEYFMNEALKEAQKSFDADEVPVGAVIVCDNKIIARAHNLTERLNDVTAHAEMQAFTSASEYLGGKYLNECTMYVTLEPCVMCAGASYWAQIGRIVYGAKDEKRGFQKIDQPLLHPKTKINGNVLGERSTELLQQFFKTKRDI
jgi:tRNA(adenine34) deaminase